jgi:trans-aconitate methyltransferase
LNQYFKKCFELLTNCKLYRNSLPRGTNLTHDLKKLSLLPINEIWDLGAHKGETTRYFANEFPQANIRSFEPISGNYNLLIQNCKKLENHNAHNFALGHENTKTKIFLQDALVIHSLRDDLNTSSRNAVIGNILAQKVS